MGLAAAQDHVEGDAHVDGVGAGVVGVGVAVPHRELVAAQGLASLVEVAGLLAEPVDELVVPQALPGADLAADPGHAPLGVVLVEGLAGRVEEGDPERRVRHADAEGRGDDLRGRGPRAHRCLGLPEVAARHRVGVVAAERARRRIAHAHHVGRERGHGDGRPRALEHERVRPSPAGRGGPRSTPSPLARRPGRGERSREATRLTRRRRMVPPLAAGAAAPILLRRPRAEASRPLECAGGRERLE